MVPIGTTAAVISILLWTIASVISKKISKGLGANLVSFLYVSISIVPILAASLLIGNFSIPLSSVLIAIFAGLFLSLGFIMTFKALSTEYLSSVVVIGELYPAIFVLFGLVVLGQSVSTIQLLSILVIFAGACMIITTEKLTINRRLIPAIIAAVAWTIYWIAMTYSVTSAGTFAFPILISRLVGIPFVVVYLMMDRNAVNELKSLGSRLGRNRTLMVLIALTAIASGADAVGDVIFGITISSAVLVIGAALVALQPMAASFFGFLFYRERLTKLQFSGLIIMVAGAFVLSVL